MPSHDTLRLQLHKSSNSEINPKAKINNKKITITFCARQLRRWIMEDNIDIKRRKFKLKHKNMGIQIKLQLTYPAIFVNATVKIL